MPKLPDWWDSHLAYLKTHPSADGLRAMADAIEPGSTVERVRRRGGGISTATSAIRLRTRAGSALDVVLKRFRGAGAKAEWQRLVFAQTLPVPAPEPLALDASGEWFGASALAMRQLPGKPNVAPHRLEPWLEQIAQIQIAIHSASARRVPAGLKKPIFEDRWKPPRGIRRTPLVKDVIAKLGRRADRAADRELSVAHRDSHPGNLLWTRERITGVTDWSEAGVAPRGYDVAYMRADIAVLLGLTAADRYRERYECLLGGPVPDLEVWDLVCALNALQWSVLWVHPYREQGADLTHDVVRRRALSFLRRSLARV